jgi:hypothetical protein
MTRHDDGTTLPHLQGPGAAVRQAIAAFAIRGSKHIIEIGGAGLPITRFLQHTPHSVTVIDPKITPLAAETLDGQPCRVRHIARKFQDVDLTFAAESVAVVMLGLSLKPLGDGSAVTDALVGLCRRADLVVIEYPIGLVRSEAQAPGLIADAGLTVAFSVDLTIRDGVIEHTEHNQRRLMLLRPAAPGPQTA